MGVRVVFFHLNTSPSTQRDFCYRLCVLMVFLIITTFHTSPAVNPFHSCEHFISNHSYSCLFFENGEGLQTRRTKQIYAPAFSSAHLSHSSWLDKQRRRTHLRRVSLLRLNPTTTTTHLTRLESCKPCCHIVGWLGLKLCCLHFSNPFRSVNYRGSGKGGELGVTNMPLKKRTTVFNQNVSTQVELKGFSGHAGV